MHPVSQKLWGLAWSWGKGKGRRWVGRQNQEVVKSRKA